MPVPSNGFIENVHLGFNNADQGSCQVPTLVHCGGTLLLFNGVRLILTKLPYFTTRQLKGQELIVSFLTTLPNKGLKKPDRSNLLTHAVKTVITWLNVEVTSESTPSSHEEWKQKMKLWAFNAALQLI